MDLEIKKDITSNWFKMLQEAIWHTITNLERKDADIKTTVWNRSKTVSYTHLTLPTILLV